MQDKQQLNELLFKACTTEDKFINKEAVVALLEAGADPNYTVSSSLFPMASKNNGFPLLHVIARNINSVEIAELLINYGAELTKKDTCIGNTPLLTAIALGDEPLAKFFIQYTLLSNDPSAIAMLSQKDEGLECQNTPIILAMKKDMDDLALMLIEMGSDVNVVARNQMTALHWAAMLRKNTLIDALLKKGAKTDIPNRWGYTASDYYDYEIKLIDIAEHFRLHNISDSLTSNMLEFSDLYYHIENTSEKISALPVQNRIKIRNAVAINQNLSKALKSKHTAETSLTARHEMIVKEQLPRVVQCRKQLGSSLFVEKSYLTYLENIDREETNAKDAADFKNAPLSFAFKEKDSEKINALLSDMTIDVNAASVDGFTALHWTCMQRHEERIKTLMARGADPTLKNKYGRTPIDYYQYEMRAADFEHAVDRKEYETLKKHLASGDAQMPEFSEFTNDPFLANLFRKRKPINLSLFERKSETTSSEKPSSVKENTSIPVQGFIKTGKEENYKPIKSKSLKMESFSPKEEIVFFDNEWIVSKQLVHASKEKYAFNVWDVNTGKYITTLNEISSMGMQHFANLKDARIATGSFGCPLTVWNVNTGKCISILGENIDDVQALKALSNNQVVVGYYDGSIRIWDVNTRQCLKVLKTGAHTQIRSIDILNGRLVSVVFDRLNKHGIIQVWDLKTEACLKTCDLRFNAGIQGGITIVSNDLAVVASGGDKHTLQVWDINVGICLRVLEGHDNSITCMRTLNNKIVSASYDKTLRIWDWKEGKCLKILQGHTDVVVGIHVLSRDKFLTLSQDGSIKTWESFLAFSSAAELRKNTRTLHEFLNPNPKNQEWRNKSFFSTLPKDLVDKIISSTRDPEFHTEEEAQLIIASHSCKPT